MSHRSRRGDDRDRSHSSHKYDKYEKYEKYEHRHRRDDSRDRDYYHSKSRRSKYHSRSRSPSYGSKSYSRHHRDSRSRSPEYSSRYQDDYHRSHRHRSRDRKDESKSRHDSREHSQSKYNTNEKFDTHDSMRKQNTKSGDTANIMVDGTKSAAISHQNNTSTYNTNELPKTIAYDPNDPDAVLEEEKQRIQRETLERLQKHLEAEGKSYPPKKPQASHPIFANDGSFLEMFKSMQGNMQQQNQLLQQPQLSQPPQNTNGIVQPAKPTVPTTSTNAINRFQPINRRRGAKILKTGIVQKQRVIEETDEATAASNDSWNTYLKEVKRYKTVTCSDDNMTRSLVK